MHVPRVQHPDVTIIGVAALPRHRVTGIDSTTQIVNLRPPVEISLEAFRRSLNINDAAR